MSVRRFTKDRNATRALNRVEPVSYSPDRTPAPIHYGQAAGRQYRYRSGTSRRVNWMQATRSSPLLATGKQSLGRGDHRVEPGRLPWLPVTLTRTGGRARCPLACEDSAVDIRPTTCCYRNR